MGKIYWNKESNLAYANGLKKLSNNTTDRQGQMNSEFQGITNNGLADQTIGDISNGFESLSGVFKDTGNVFDKFTNSIFDDEVKQASDISSMKIPKDFLADNATEVSYYNSVLLSKLDGKSVNEGHKTEKVNDVDDSEVVREALSNINNNVTQQQNYDNTSSIVGESILENINGNTTEAQKYDDASSISSNTIRNINGNTTETQKYDDASSISSNTIRNINGNTTETQKYDDTSSISSNSIKNISGNTTQKQTLNGESSLVGDSLLGNINGNDKTTIQTFDNGSIRSAVASQEINHTENKLKDEKNGNEQLQKGE